MDRSVLEKKSSFEVLGLSFSSKLGWGSYIISIAKITSKKIRDLICFMKFLSPEVALYLHKSAIRPSCLSCTLGSSSKCSQLKSFLYVLFWLDVQPVPLLEGDPLFILIDCMIFLSPLLDVTRMSMLTVSLLAQLDSGILCL